MDGTNTSEYTIDDLKPYTVYTITLDTAPATDGKPGGIWSDAIQIQTKTLEDGNHTHKNMVKHKEINTWQTYRYNEANFFNIFFFYLDTILLDLHIKCSDINPTS